MWKNFYNFYLLFCQTCFHLLFLCLITERIIEECVRRSNFSSSRTSRTTKKRRCCLLWFCIIFKTKKIVSTKKKYYILPFFHPLYIKKNTYWKFICDGRYIKKKKKFLHVDFIFSRHKRSLLNSTTEFKAFFDFIRFFFSNFAKWNKK